MTHVVLVLVCLLAAVSGAAAQQRPLVTEDPETIGGGRLLIEAGVDLEQDVFFPLSGLRGNRLVAPTMGVSIGLSSIAELQIDGAFYQKLAITERRPAPLSGVLEISGDETTDVEDFVIATKLRFFPEGARRPAFGLQLATKLPNASNEPGLGTDMTDFFASLLFAKTIGALRMVFNGGVAVIGDPTSEQPDQNDMFTFGASLARAFTDSAEVVGEINGRLHLGNGATNVGAENRAVMRLGARYTRGSVRVDAALLLGMTSRDPSVGATAGFTWVLNAFRVP